MKDFDQNDSIPWLYRKRLIPEECIPLFDDVILFFGDDTLVTSWRTIRPKKNMDHGYSCYYLKEGYKISKFYRADHTLLYYYCDIISPIYEKDTNSLTDELVTASQNGLLSVDRLREALSALNRLLSRLYGGELSELLAPINEFDRENSRELLPV